MTRFYDRLWLMAIALVPWLVQPGLIQPDTKVDLTISPWTYLSRALDAWNGHNGLGELQNQAYGYLFPMGPVFGVGQWIGLPAWAVQRVWWTLLIVVAFTGSRALIRAWGIAGPTASLVGATAYALSPRVLTLLSDHSVEAWPGAIAPWILLVATGYTDRWVERRSLIAVTARIGLLTAALGGVNATASGVAVLPAIVLLAVHPYGRRRIPLLLCGITLGALWWALPLLVLGRYAYPFLDYIETASITTAVTSVPNSLRGADDWVAYILDSQNHPVWQGGWVVAQATSSIVLTCAVAAIGCVGVMRMSGAVRRFAVASIVLGMLVMVVGHPGFAGSPVAQPVRELLDGPLVVLRNVHKFDLLVRLPLAMGVAGAAGTLAHRPGRTLMHRRVAAGAVVGLLAASMVPIWQGRLGSASSYRAIPASWQSAARQIDAMNSGDGSTLLLPSSRTASYTWGSAVDEPLSALATTPVVVRASAPLGNPAATRLLDAVDALAASGQSQPALATTLARMGISVVVVRRDLAPNAGAGPWKPVERTLASSPGILPVEGQADPHRSIWRVELPAPQRYSQQVVLRGGPEGIPAALATGAIDASDAVVLDGDTRSQPTLVTDSLVWRTYANGMPAEQAYGPVLPPTDSAPGRAGSKDLPPLQDASLRPHRELVGLDALTASSSAADPFAKAYVSVAHSQFAAIDGDASTTWLSGDHEQAPWLRLALAYPAKAGTLTLTLAKGVGVVLPRTVTVNGQQHAVPASGVVQQRIAAGTRSVTLQLHAPVGAVDPTMGVSEVALSNTPRLGAPIVVPGLVALAHQALLLGADTVVPTVPARAGETGSALVRRVVFDASATPATTVWIRDATTPPSQCGRAGSLRINQRTYPLQFTDAASGDLRRAVVCGSTPVQITGGGTDIRVEPAAGGQAVYALFGTVRRTPTQLIATTHGANAGWEATASTGVHLPGQVIDGWRQGFVAAGTDGRTVVHMRFTPTTSHRIGLGIGVAAVIALLLLAWRTRRESVVERLESSREVGDEDEGSASRWPPIVAAAAVGALAAGLVGLIVVAVVSAIPQRFRPICAAGALVAAGVALAAGGVVDQRSWGAGAGQVLGTVTLVLLVLAARARGSTPNASAPDAR